VTIATIVSIATIASIVSIASIILNSQFSTLNFQLSCTSIF
jgi:hypothetical protein